MATTGRPQCPQGLREARRRPYINPTTRWNGEKLKVAGTFLEQIAGEVERRMPVE
ncbi:MAG TPA: hypothetical protein VNH39_07665 [Steroidobacteraceae bacterium]|nr:hypothetical protein [Steroidobacteraceae bacterium]